MGKFPIIEGKRFWPFALCELVDLYSHQVNAYSLALSDDPKSVANAVIRDVKYPLNHGIPDDTHLLNCFHGEYKFCKKVDADFFQRASETAFLKVGDCEDSSILGTALSGKLVGPERVYEVFGAVKDASTGKTLGYHGWYLCVWNGKWHLVESTLDQPPMEYPVVVHIKQPYTWNNVIYEPWVLFNWKHYIELKPIMQYLALGFEAKERRRKYEAIELAFGLKAKPLKKLGFTAKLRWK